MPKITDLHEEVLADDDNAVLGDVMTVDEPKRLRHQAKRRQHYYKPVSPLAQDLGLADSGVSRAIVASAPQTSLRAPEDDEESLARLLVVPGGIVAGAAKGALYGALLGNGTTARRLGGGALGGAVAFPALSALAKYAEDKLAERGSSSPLVNAVLDDVAHVGGATASVAAAGGEAVDGAIAGTAVVLASHVLGWFVGR
jgi:hypothetical protein